MSNTQTPVDEDFARSFLDLQRQVADIANASVGKQFSTGDIVSHYGTTRAGALLMDGSTIANATYPNLTTYLIAQDPTLIVDANNTKLPNAENFVLGGAGGGWTLGVGVGNANVTLTGAQSGQPAISAGTTGSTTPGSVTSGAGSSHAHTVPFATGSGASGFLGGSVVGGSGSTSAEAAHTHTVAGSAHTHTTPAIAAANAAQSHSVLQPTLPVYLFIVI